jgi:hypothetical protein
MNARGMRSVVSSYGERERRKGGGVMWDTAGLARRKVGAASVTEVSPRRATRRQSDPTTRPSWSDTDTAAFLVRVSSQTASEGAVSTQDRST